VDRIFAEGRVRPPDLGGTDGTAAVANAVMGAIEHTA
jgi:hypothetical protein